MSRKLLRYSAGRIRQSHGGMASPHRGGYAWLSRLPLDFLRWAGYARHPEREASDVVDEGLAPLPGGMGMS